MENERMALEDGGHNRRLLNELVSSIKALQETLQPKEPSYEDKMISWFETFWTTAGTLGTFFAGFSLSIATSESIQGVSQDYAAISSLLFVLDVLLCFACALVINCRRDDIGSLLERGGWVANGISVFSLVLELLFLIAVAFFFLVMKDISPAAGWIGLGFTVFFILVGVGIWVGLNQEWLFHGVQYVRNAKETRKTPQKDAINTMSCREAAHLGVVTNSHG